MENELGQPVGVSIDVERPDLPSREPMAGTFCRLESLDANLYGADLFTAYSAAQDDGDWTYLFHGPFEDKATFDDWLESVEGHDDPVFFAIIDQPTDKAVGVCSYLRIDPYAASIEVGSLHFSRQMQKTPAATEAMYLMMKRAFDGGYRRYEWKCDDLNMASRAAAVRLGFQYEGTFRQATHYKGRNRDTAWYSIIDSEWPALEASFARWLSPENFDETGVQRSGLQDGDEGRREEVAAVTKPEPKPRRTQDPPATN